MLTRINAERAASAAPLASVWHPPLGRPGSQPRPGGALDDDLTGFDGSDQTRAAARRLRRMDGPASNVAVPRPDGRRGDERLDELDGHRDNFLERIVHAVASGQAAGSGGTPDWTEDFGLSGRRRRTRGSA